MKLSVLCLMLLTVPAVSTGSTLTFDEFGITPAIDVNGLKMPGVLFGFTPGQATYNGTIGTSGNAVFSIDPVLMGPTTGTLDLTFTYLTPILQFDIVLQSIFPIDDSSSGPDGGPAYTVLLSNGTTLTGSTTPQPDGFFTPKASSNTAATRFPVRLSRSLAAPMREGRRCNNSDSTILHLLPRSRRRTY